MTEPEPVHLTLATGELVELPVGPNRRMWVSLSPEQAAEVRQRIAEAGPGARFVAETPEEDADPLAKLIAAMANFGPPNPPGVLADNTNQET